MSKRYIGMFDILGFKDLIETYDLASVVNRAQRFISLAKGVGAVPTGGCGENLLIRLFQDTVIVLTPAATQSDFRCILEYSCALVGFAFLQDITLRGAIAEGEAHADEQFVIGKGVVKVYQMEQQQDWMGCWIDDACVDRLPSQAVKRLEKDGLLLRYRVPMKSGPMRETWALNWPLSIFHLKGKAGEKAWNRAWRRACEGPISWDARKKLEQTDRFLSEVARLGLLPRQSK